MSHDLLYWHNKGEQDYVENNGYNPPNDELEIALDADESARKKLIAQNKAYQEGYEIAKEQDD
jgi:hypothetical protein